MADREHALVGVREQLPLQRLDAGEDRRERLAARAARSRGRRGARPSMPTSAAVAAPRRGARRGLRPRAARAAPRGSRPRARARRRSARRSRALAAAGSTTGASIPSSPRWRAASAAWARPRSVSRSPTASARSRPGSALEADSPWRMKWTINCGRAGALLGDPGVGVFDSADHASGSLPLDEVGDRDLFDAPSGSPSAARPTRTAAARPGPRTRASRAGSSARSRAGPRPRASHRRR